MGEKGKVLASLPSLHGRARPGPSDKQSSDTLCRSVRQDAVGVGAAERPERCPKCQGNRVWGHGYVEAYFDEAGSPCVLLKRYRCPQCGVVIRLRPSGYWKRIQATVASVRQCLVERLEKGRWPPGCNSARARHWLCGLRRQVRTHLGMSYAERLAEGFAELLRRGLGAVGRAV
jgi:hypothetical protein